MENNIFNEYLADTSKTPVPTVDERVLFEKILELRLLDILKVNIKNSIPYMIDPLLGVAEYKAVQRLEGLIEILSNSKGDD